MSNTCAPSGGANSAKTTLPPPSNEYRHNYDEIFRKKEISSEKKTKHKLRLRLTNPED